MNYRVNQFYARKSFTSDTTEVIDIDISDVISNIIIKFEGTNSTGINTSPLFDGITKIELVDGSDVLFSLSGVQAEAVDWYANGGKFRYNWNIALNGNGYTRQLAINFGRYQFDPLYALDPKLFSNLQLRITLDIDGGGNAPGTVYLTCWANIFDEKIVNPVGFFMTKELKQWTMANTVHEYTALPTDYPYRAIYQRCHLAGTESNQCIAGFKLSEDQDKRVPFDLDSAALISSIVNNYPAVEETYLVNITTSARYLYIAATTRVTAVGNFWAATALAVDTSFYDGDGGKLAMINNQATKNTQVHVRGQVPHAVFEILCGLKNEPDDWYNVGGINSLRADVTGGAAAQGHLFIQQVRPY